MSDETATAPAEVTKQPAPAAAKSKKAAAAAAPAPTIHELFDQTLEEVARKGKISTGDVSRYQSLKHKAYEDNARLKALIEELKAKL